MSSDGDNWAWILTNNLKYIMFFGGMFMIIITPLWMFRSIKKKRFKDIGVGAILGMFGVAFFLAGLMWDVE